MRKDLINLKTFHNLGISLILVFILGLGENAFAEEIYNYYFQKSQSQKISKTKDKLKAPAPVVKSQAGKTPEANEEYKKWELSVGWGTVFGAAQVYAPLSSGGTVQTTSGYSQNLYVIGGKYNITRFFDAHGALHLPNSDISLDRTMIGFQEESGVAQAQSTLDFQLMLGMGTTPLHFDFLGFNFLELGWDVSFILGDENYLGGNSSVLVWGPRAAINFSSSVSLLLSIQREIQRSGGSSIGVTSARFAYRF